MIERLLSHFQKDLPDGLPKNYLAFDTETTGLDKQVDLLWQFGFCLAREGLPAKGLGYVLNWFSHPLVDSWWLESRLDYQRRQMSEKGLACHSSKRLLQSGRDPLPTLEKALELLSGSSQGDRWVVGHNILRFDIPFVQSTWHRWLGRVADIDLERCLDTGAIAKGLEAGMSPKPGERLLEYSLRVLNARKKGVKWSLTDYVAPKHKLFEKHGLDRSQAHFADFDARLVHLYLEELRSHDLSPAASGVPAASGGRFDG